MKQRRDGRKSGFAFGFQAIHLKVIGCYLLLLAFGLFFAMPFFWMVQASFQSPEELVTYPPRILPSKFTIENYVSIVTDLPTPHMFWNSIVVAVTTTLLSLVFCSMAGYAFAHVRFRGRDALYSIVLLTMMVPFYVVLIPLFLVVNSLGLINSRLGVIIPFIMSPVATFMFRQYFIQIPSELIEAATIDGANQITIWRRIAFPLSRPMLVTVGIFMFIASWNSFIWPLIVLRSQESWTLPVGLHSISLQAKWKANWGATLAGATMFFAPMAVIYLFLQRQFVEGMLRSGIRG